MIKVIIFDFDGVILDSVAIKTSAFTEIFKDFPEEKVKEFVEYHLINGGISRFIKIKYFFENLMGISISEDEVFEYADRFAHIVMTELVSPKYLIRQTIDFIGVESKEKKLFVASGAKQEEVRYLCSVFNIGKFFNGVYGSPVEKSQILKQILAESGCAANECILIGDSINDYEAARKNGISFFGFNNISLLGYGEGYIENFAEFVI